MQDGVIAQLVEQWTENPCVAGSTPARTTKPQYYIEVFFMPDKSLLYNKKNLLPLVK